MSLDTFFEPFCEYELPRVAATKKKPAPKKKKPAGKGPVRTMAVPERPAGDDYETPTEDIPDED